MCMRHVRQVLVPSPFYLIQSIMFMSEVTLTTACHR